MFNITLFLPLLAAPISSYRQLSFTNIEKQETSYFCGISAIQFILKNYKSVEIAQSDIMSLVLLSSGTERKADGISLLDIKNVLERWDIKSLGIRSSEKDIDLLTQSFAFPFLLHFEKSPINNKVLGHFVIVYGMKDDFYFISDPALGDRILTKNQLQAAWSGYTLAFENISPSIRTLDSRALNRLEIIDHYWRK